MEKKKRQRMRKKGKKVQIDVRFILSNESCTLHFVNNENVNNANVLPETANLRISTEKQRNTGITNDENTSTLRSLEKGTRETHGTEKRDGETCSSLQENNIQDSIMTINNPKNEACTFQPANEKDNSDIQNFSLIDNASSVYSASESELSDSLMRDLMSNQCVRREIVEQLVINCSDFFPIFVLIHTIALNMYMIEETLEKYIFCFICQRFHHMDRRIRYGRCTKVKQLQKWLIEHVREHATCYNDIYVSRLMMDEDKESFRNEKYFSTMRLATEYIIKPSEKYSVPEHMRIDSYTCLLCENFTRSKYESTMEDETFNFESTTEDEMFNFESTMEDNYQSIHKHITSSTHQNLKESLASRAENELQQLYERLNKILPAKRSRCELCNYECILEMDLAKHLTAASHTTRFAAIPENDRKKFDYYFCYACLVLWFGHCETYEQHDELDEHKNNASYYPYIQFIPESAIHLLTWPKNNLEVLLTESDNTCKNEKLRYMLHGLITDLKDQFPNVRAYPFGSRMSGLALPGSDIDIFLNCDYTYNGKITHKHCQEILMAIEARLSQTKTWQIQKIVLESRTPIIRIYHNRSEFTCDIAVTNGLGVENTKLIKCLLDAFPMCRQLILFLKRWLRLCELSGSNLITSYAISWCAIFYLQTLEVFPSIADLIKLKNERRRISGWEVGVSYDVPIQQINHTFEELLFGFFKFYAKFNYKCVICPLLGREIAKGWFWGVRNTKKIKEMAPYVAYMRRRTNPHTGERPKAFPTTSLSVQDPFDLSHNITKAMNANKLQKFRKCCKWSAKLMKSNLSKTAVDVNPKLD